MGAYAPRAGVGTVLHGVVRDYLESFLAAAAARTDGVGLPAFIEREFRSFLRCGLLVHGFMRVRCDACAYERLVPFSCKKRARSAHEPVELLERLAALTPRRRINLVLNHGVLAPHSRLARAGRRLWAGADGPGRDQPGQRHAPTDTTGICRAATRPRGRVTGTRVAHLVLGRVAAPHLRVRTGLPPRTGSPAARGTSPGARDRRCALRRYGRPAGW